MTHALQRNRRISARGAYLFSPASSAPKPAMGTEILADPGLEATYTLGLCDSLAKGGTPTVAQETVDMHGGLSAQSFIAAATNDRVQYNFTGVVNTWYQVSGWAKRAAGAVGLDRLSFAQQDGGGRVWGPYITAASYTQYVMASRAAATTLMEQLFAGLNSFDTILLDDMSAKAITLASMFSLVGDAKTKQGRFEFLIPTLSAGTQAGLAFCLDSETNPLWYLLARHDGANFYLDKVENGVPTILINTPQTWGATAKYVIVKKGSAITCYADDVLINVAQSVDTTNYGTKVARFSALDTNRVSQVRVRRL